MDIDATELRALKRGGRQNQAVRNDHQRVELQAAQDLQGFLRLEADRLMDAEPTQSCQGLDGTRVQWLTAARGAVRLGEHGANPLRRGKCIQCRDSEFRRAGETQP